MNDKKRMLLYLLALPCVFIFIISGIQYFHQKILAVGIFMPIINGLIFFAIGVFLGILYGNIREYKKQFILKFFLLTFSILLIVFYFSPYVIGYNIWKNNVSQKLHISSRESSELIDKYLLKETSTSGFWGYVKLATATDYKPKINEEPPEEIFDFISLMIRPLSKWLSLKVLKINIIWAIELLLWSFLLGFISWRGYEFERSPN